MAVTSCVKQRGSDTTTVEKNNQRTHGSTYAITTNNLMDSYNAATQATAIGPHPLPPVWSVHPFDPSAFVDSVSLTRHAADNYRFDAQVSWRTRQPSEQNPATSPGGTLHPLLRPVRYSVDFDTRTQIKEFAFAQTALSYPQITIGDFVAVVNAAGQPFDTPLVDETTDAVLVMEKNYSNLGTIMSIHEVFSGTTNGASLFGYDKHHCRYMTPSVSELNTEVIGNLYIYYYTVRWRVLFSGIELYHEIVNRGTKVVNAGGDVEDATDAWKNPVSEPVLLAANGTKLADGQKGNIIKYRTLREVSYTYWQTFQTSDLPPLWEDFEFTGDRP